MIRVKVEIVPNGRIDAAEVLNEIWIENDGTSMAGVGPNEGGIGNYNIFPDGETLEHLHVVDYPSMYACGHLRGVPRTRDHRFIVAAEALSIVRAYEEQVKAAEAEPGYDPARAPQLPKVEREFEVA